MSYIVDISLPEISCVFQMFTFVTSCCSPHISTSQQKSSTECLIWCHSGCVRILPFDRLRGLCHSTVSKSHGYGFTSKSHGYGFTSTWRFFLKVTSKFFLIKIWILIEFHLNKFLTLQFSSKLKKSFSVHLSKLGHALFLPSRQEAKSGILQVHPTFAGFT